MHTSTHHREIIGILAEHSLVVMVNTDKPELEDPPVSFKSFVCEIMVFQLTTMATDKDR